MCRAEEAILPALQQQQLAATILDAPAFARRARLGNAAGMLSFVKRLAYRDRVLEQLSTLLVMYPRGRQFANDFPPSRQ